jgi:hypothetical protein
MMTELEKHLLAQLMARPESPLERLQRELRELAAKDERRLGVATA